MSIWIVNERRGAPAYCPVSLCASCKQFTSPHCHVCWHEYLYGPRCVNNPEKLKQLRPRLEKEAEEWAAWFGPPRLKRTDGRAARFDPVRAARIVAARGAGEKLKEIALREKISIERVRQIIGKEARKTLRRQDHGCPAVPAM